MNTKLKQLNTLLDRKYQMRPNIKLNGSIGTAQSEIKIFVGELLFKTVTHIRLSILTYVFQTLFKTCIHITQCQYNGML